MLFLAPPASYLRLCILSTLGLCAMSATAATANPISDDSLPQVELDEIVVTAQKRAESITDVPLTVTALSGESLARIGVDEFDEVAAYIPGLIVQEQSPNNPGFVIRGITSDSGSAQ